MITEQKLQELKDKGEVPHFLTVEGFQTLSKGYLQDNETVKEMYERVARTICSYMGYSKELEEDIFDVSFNKGWLGFATPILSNSGTEDGLPISCYIMNIDDRMEDIMGRGLGELAMLSKMGGGVGVSFQNIRPSGSFIKKGKGGTSDGIVPFAKVYDSAILASKQPKVRRGNVSLNLSIEHGDALDFIDIRRQEGDPNRQALNIHHCVTISDEFMNRVKDGDKIAQFKFYKLMKARIEKGEPYILYEGNVNSRIPEGYVKNLGLTTIPYTNICCLSGDTEVLTKEGIFQIKDLIGKEVTIFDGKDWVKNSSFELKGKAPLYRIHFKNGSYVDCTENHRWFVSENYKQIEHGILNERTTKDLQIGSWVEYHNEQYHGNIKAKGAYVKGFLIGDGTSHKGKPIMNIHKGKFQCIEKLLQSMSEVPIIGKFRNDCITEPSVSDTIDITGNHENVLGEQVFKRVRGLVSRKVELFDYSSKYKKEFPQEVFEWDRDSKLEFLAGLLDSDGTIGKHNSIQINSVHPDFIKGLQKLLITLGVTSNIDKPKTSKAHRLTLSSYDSFHNLSDMKSVRIKMTHEPNRRTTGFRKIVAIEKLEGIHDVYCPSVPSTGKFALANGLMTGNSEILKYADAKHTVTCCISSLNLAKYPEWKDWKSPRTGKSLVEITTFALDGVMEEFIQRGKGIPFLDNAIRAAVKDRGIGIGVMGWHTLLQENMIPFESFKAMQLNNEIFKKIDEESRKASQDLALLYGEPEWCRGTGLRNVTRTAIAPTKSNSVINGDVSAGIEPITANCYSEVSPKGTFVRKNKTLIPVLEKYNLNDDDTWRSIEKNNGSIKHLPLPEDIKEVFLTAYEINQKAIIQQAAQRTPYICQSQSVNLFFPNTVDPEFFAEVHMLAWELGVKTLYYCKSTKDRVESDNDECKSCHG